MPVYRVYCWGMTLSTDPEPVEVLRTDDPIIDVQAGSLYSLVLTSAGSVFAWGAGSHGRLGLGDERNQIRPVRLPFGTPVAAISASNWFSLLLGRDGVLYRCGKFGGTCELSPVAAPELGGFAATVTACAAGDRCFSVIVGREVYVVGSSEALLASLFPPSVMPASGSPFAVLVPLPSPATSIAVRGRSFMALCEDRHAYAWGFNTSRCLGVDSSAPVVWPPKLVIVAPATNRTRATEPDAIEAPSPGGISTTLVAASLSPSHINVHALFLDSLGSVYAAGSNYKFKTGIPSSSTRQNNTHSCECVAPPRAVPFFSSPDSPRVIRVACGALHSLAVTSDGELLLWGCGSDGRLGFPEFRERRARYLYHEPLPRRLTSLRGRVTTAHTFWWHTVAVTVE